MFFVQYFSPPSVQETLYGDVGAFPILGLHLEQRQDFAISLSGGEWLHSSSDISSKDIASLWIRRDCHVSQETVQAFVAQAKKRISDVDIVVARITGRFGNLLSDLRFGEHGPLLFWTSETIDVEDFLPIFQKAVTENQNTSQDEELLVEIANRNWKWCWSDIDPVEKIYPMPVSRYQFGVDLIEIPLSDFILIPTGHWMQLLWANLLSLGPFLYRELLGRSFGEVVVNLTTVFFKTFSFDPLTLGLRLRRVGKNVKIHPSAVVEACWIGDDVRIGANAVVRGCILGKGVKIEDLALVEFSTLSAGTIIQRQAMVKFSVTNKNCGVGGVIQLGVMDEGALIKRGSYLMDMSLAEGGVSILYNGRKFGVPLGLGGCAIGTRSTLGCGVRVAAGRFVPAFAQVVADVDQSLLKISKDIMRSSMEKIQELENSQHQDEAFEEPKQTVLVCKNGGLEEL